jgi:hypothetical protein
MELRTTSLNFPALRGTGPVSQIANVHFPREVQKAIAGISGYSAGFQARDDHPLGVLQVQLDTRIDGDLVEVTGTLGVRDWSGTWDDNYEGNIHVVVIAELASATDPRPRGDLEIVGMEITQATQHFRSDRHLDSANVRPDNSIPLFSRKDTAVRVYVDYDRNSGLPQISNLSGELTIDTGFNSVTFTPQNSIFPMRENLIDRGQIDHTLNFVIPEGFCQTQLVLRCKVFDLFNPASASRIFEKTIFFDNRTPLNLYAVGIHYTGQDLDLPAPTLNEIVGTTAFSKMEVVYPVPEVLIAGYTEIEFSKDMKADIANGCGDGYNSLLDMLKDMQAGSDDVYYGFLPNGFDGGSVGGCGGGGRVAASPFTAFGGLAQETGHAFGRRHAPCDSTARCSNPANQDDQYPKYADFDSDSIGEFGYNPRTNSLFSPADSHDFMSYSPNRFVSPYTYMALAGSFYSSEGFTAFMASELSYSSESPHESHQVTEGPWIRAATMKLFLWMEIDRKRNVKRLPSFHYYSKNENDHAHSHHEDSGFSVELTDDEGRTLSCQVLQEDCENCFENCFPKTFRQFIPFDERSKKLIVYEDEQVIYEEDLVPAQDHTIEHEYDKKQKGFQMKWAARGKNEINHWYLIHWQDTDGQWRGLAPRTSGTSAFIPLSLFGRRKKLNLRLLCSAGICTKILDYVIELQKQVETEITVLPVGNVHSKDWLTVSAFDNNKSISNPEIVWYNDNHMEIGKGRSLHVKELRKYNGIVHAVVFFNGKRYQTSFDINPQGNHEGIRLIEKQTMNNTSKKWK